MGHLLYSMSSLCINFMFDIRMYSVKSVWVFTGVLPRSTQVNFRCDKIQLFGGSFIRDSSLCPWTNSALTQKIPVNLIRFTKKVFLALCMDYWDNFYLISALLFTWAEGSCILNYIQFIILGDLFSLFSLWGRYSGKTTLMWSLVR